MKNIIEINNLCKSFTLHLQGGISIPVLDQVSLAASGGECVAIAGSSGAGKSTLLKCLYANYRAQAGSVRVRHRDTWVDMAHAHPRDVLDVRRHTMGYVSQFLRVIPRVPALDIVMAPMLTAGTEQAKARSRAQTLLERLNIPARLWPLPPATFSGGEQQRVNIARAFAPQPPVLLLDEPTASLDDANSGAVVDLIREARRRGTVLVGIFHDHSVRTAVATRIFQLRPAGAPV